MHADSLIIFAYVFSGSRLEVVRFQSSIEQLQAKEEVIKQRDHNIQRLKDSQKHLEGFRYVLFHKVMESACVCNHIST